MPMNLDKLMQKKTECVAALTSAVQAQDAEKINTALEGYSQYLTETIVTEAQTYSGAAAEQAILAARGVRQLTQAEERYYNDFIEASKSADPKQAITNITSTFPVTIIDAVLDDIKKTHRILDLVNFNNTSLYGKYLYNKTGKPAVSWNDVMTAITNEITPNIGIKESTLYKLSALIFVPKDVLDLGALWVDRYVREILGEYIAAGLEDAFVYGDGNKKPIGMARDVSANASVVAGVHPLKTAVALNKITPTTVGSVLAVLATDENGEARAVTEPIFIVNPFDYFSKVMPATTIRGADGTYRNDVMPYPMEIIQSAALPTGSAIMGIPKKYYAALGMSKGGKIDYDDSFKFGDDLRTYLCKMLATGEALDDNAFVLLDITNLVPQNLEVEIKNTSINVDVVNDADHAIPVNEVTALLKSLRIGALTLTPAFDPSVKVYTAATTAATNTITAVAESNSATIAIANGATAVTNGEAATWETGENVVTITVSNSPEAEVYKVTVTKS